MTDMPAMKFGVIIDEAHSGQTSSKKNAILAHKHNEDEEQKEKAFEVKINVLIESGKMITNGSLLSFTATPKNKTIETFGVNRQKSTPMQIVK